VASDGYEVTVSDLEDASVAFKPEGDGALQARTRFEAAADLPDSAFGNTPGSSAIASRYQEFFGQVTRDVAKVSEALQAGAQTLSANAARYRAADQGVVDYLRRLGASGQEIARLQEGR
jgi:uncharacterized protein YukE